MIGRQVVNKQAYGGAGSETVRVSRCVHARCQTPAQARWVRDRLRNRVPLRLPVSIASLPPSFTTATTGD